MKTYLKGIDNVCSWLSKLEQQKEHAAKRLGLMDLNPPPPEFSRADFSLLSSVLLEDL